MKIAFVHDWIVHEGGAEAVLRELIENRDYDDAKIFVLFSTNEKLEMRNKKLEIITALPRRLNNFFIYFNTRTVPVLSKIFDYRNLMFWFPLLCRLLRKKIEKYRADEIVISSFAAVKNIIKQKVKSKKHNNIGTANSMLSPSVILYLHSPMQYIRENYEENVAKLSFPIKQIYQFAAIYLRPWDKKHRHYDVVLCNSNYTAKLAKQLYGLEGEVSYPHIAQPFFDEPIAAIPKEYFVFVGRVQKYVREIDRVIQTCNATHAPLIVIGEGPDMDYAKSIAGPTIIFVGRIDDVQEKIALIKHAKGLINIAKESFGIATAEALCLGVPVLGYNSGATPELVNDRNGVLIDDKSTSSIKDGLHTFLEKDFDREQIAAEAKETFKNI